jgi:glutathione S-transferase
MIEIWGRASSSNVQKVLWCCDELDIRYQRYDTGREFGGNDTPAYLEMNPNGLVPTIRDSGLVVWESNTILRYLAARYGDGSMYPAELAPRSQVDRWLDWEVGTLAPTILPVFWGLIRTPPEQRDEEKLAGAKTLLSKVLTVLDLHLSKQSYVAGDCLTLADIAMGNSVYRWFAFSITRPDLPALRAWYDRIAGHPGFRMHIAKPLV